MKRKTKNILREIAMELGLKIVFVNYLSDDIHGKLLPREKRILINANKPRYEHVYTLLHEFGHFQLHFKNCAPNRFNRWYLNRRWKIEAIAVFASKVRRHLRFKFNTHAGKEWEADLWALCALLYLQKFIGRSYLTTFLARHPEKTSVFLVAVSGMLCDAIKKRAKTAFQIIWKPFIWVCA
ncbi:MAG TPA: ImmA/IrrE family metallo-endopeptidase [Verrucomicrobiae bacterium]|jgi:hypothetical protein